MNCIGLILHQKIHPVFSRHANEKLLTIVQVFGHLRWPMLVVKASHLVHPWCAYSMSGQALHQTRASRKTLTLIVFCISIIWNQKTQNYYQGISFLCLETVTFRDIFTQTLLFSKQTVGWCQVYQCWNTLEDSHNYFLVIIVTFVSCVLL